jgi:guanylate kinase
MAREGIFFLLAGPSGAGKTTILKELVGRSENLHKDIAVTTRSPRHGERDGVDYHFWSVDRFKAEVNRSGFLEHAIVHGRDHYGTLKDLVQAQLAQGFDVIKDIDVQGVKQIQSILPYPRSVAIFMIPPSAQDLERRLRMRGSEEETVVQRRLQTAREEVRQVGAFDYLLFNHSIDAAVNDLAAVRRAEQCKRLRCETIFRASWGC